MLTRTHGVPVYQTDPSNESAGIVSWRLEVPGMLMNHSCDPNVIDDSHDAVKGEGVAARDIKKGEELTYNYVTQFYDRGPFFEECLCGAAACRGKMMGFKALVDEDKKTYFPVSSWVVQIMHEAEAGRGLPVKDEQTSFPKRKPSPDDDYARRLVFPGPGHALAEVAVRRDECGEFGLYALKDFSFGKRVYYFWCQDWPFDGRSPIDVSFSTPLTKGDPPEGTIIRVRAKECASKDRLGHYQFSGWDLLTKHCCEPNLAYNDVDEDEDDNWRGAYAVRDIKAGELLTIDFTSILWDRTGCKSDGACQCGATKCTGVAKGFRHLPVWAQNERKFMTWRRVGPPYGGEKNPDDLGMALTPHVRVSWREDSKLKDDAPDSPSSSSSSSSDESLSSSDEEKFSHDEEVNEGEK